MNRFIEVLKDGVDANYAWYNAPVGKDDEYRERLESLGFDGISPFKPTDVAYGMYNRMQVIAMFKDNYIQIFVVPTQRLGYFLNFIYRFCDTMPVADQLWGYVEYGSIKEWNELKEYIDDVYGIIR